MHRLALLLALIMMMVSLSACFRDASTETLAAEPQTGVDTVADAATAEVTPSLDPAAPTATPTEDLALQATPTQGVTEVAQLEPTATFTETATATPTITIDPQLTLTAQYAMALGQGGAGDAATPTPEDDLNTEAIPPVEVGQVVTATPTATNTATATDTATNTATSTVTATNTALPTNTPLPTNTALPTNTPLPTNTALPTNTPLPSNTPAPTNTSGPLPTLTTIPLTPYIGSLQVVSNPVGVGGSEVAQVATVDPNAQGLLPNQQTATAVIAAATATQASVFAAQTAAAGGVPQGIVTATPEAGVVQPQAGSGVQAVPAQPLVITATPTGPTSDCQYLVGIGENLGTIARRYNLTTTDIAVANNLTNPDLIQAGYPLIIPGCGRPAPLPTSTPIPNATASGVNITPNTGDGRQLGGTSSTSPQVGQGGAIAGAIDNSQGPFTYTVTTGDNIYRLSLTYGVTMRAILASNPQIINMNLISEGQQIVIPGPPTATTAATTTTTTNSGVVIVTATFTPAVVQPQVVQPTPFTQFTPTFTPGAQGG